MNSSVLKPFAFFGMDIYLDKILDGNLHEFLAQPKIQITVSLFLLGVVLCILSYAVMTVSRKARILQKFPSVPKFPLIGSIPYLLGPPEGIVVGTEKAIELLGRIFTFWLGHTPLLVIAEANAVQKVLSSAKYIEKGRNYEQFHWLFGNGLITSNGTEWKEDRRLLSPSFKYQRFDGFLMYFNKHSKVLVEILDKVFHTENKEEKRKPVNLHPYLARCTMDFISESALGQNPSYQIDIHAKFLEAVHMSLDSFRTRLMKPWLVLPGIWSIFGKGREEKIVLKVVEELLTESIKTRKQILSNSDNDGTTAGTKPFIDALLDSKSNADIAGHMITVFGAGFETTASGMNYTLLLLAQHPEVQAKVHEELDNLLLAEGDDDVEVTFAHLAEMKLLEMCIKESLRLYPPAPAILRHAIEDIPLDNEQNQVIPKGVDMLFLIRDLHRDEKYFPNPHTFDPNHFLPENCANRHPYAYIPFSAGPRNCLGMKYAMMQMKACLAHILHRFTVSTKQGKDDIKVVYGMVLEPLPAIQVALTPRK